MRERSYWKAALPLLTLAAMLLGPANLAQGPAAPATIPSTLAHAASRNVIIIGFVGGFVNPDDTRHPEVQFAAYLRDRYHTVHAEVFGNHHGEKALREVVRILDSNHDGVLSPLEKECATIILYGHSWGATETVAFAHELEQLGVPVALTIQIDTIAKPGHKALPVSPNVASAINFYQTKGPLHGAREIVAEDPARTKILGNIRMTYQDRPINCDNYSWVARVFTKSHYEIENDLAIWDKAASLIESQLSGIASIAQALPPSESPFFKDIRNGTQAYEAAPFQTARATTGK